MTVGSVANYLRILSGMQAGLQTGDTLIQFRQCQTNQVIVVALLFIKELFQESDLPDSLPLGNAKSFAFFSNFFSNFLATLFSPCSRLVLAPPRDRSKSPREGRTSTARLCRGRLFAETRRCDAGFRFLRPFRGSHSAAG